MMNKLKSIAILMIILFNSQISFTQNKVPLTVQKELKTAEAKMFKSILGWDKGYWRNNVHKEYFSINADGVMQTKEEAMADSARKKMFAGMSYKLFDRKIRLYGNVAIINGRSQYIMNENVLGEVYHTEIWIKEKGKWMFNGWQGTYTKDGQSNLNPQENKK